jgi:cell division protein ZapA (FtsZ GTPase activity inhibitor)
MDELSISIVIADRPYKLAVEKEHEELFRKAARMIDKRIKEYSSNYAYKDKQDLLAMVALEYTTSFLQTEHSSAETENSLAEKLKTLDNTLNEILISRP